MRFRSQSHCAQSRVRSTSKWQGGLGRIDFRRAERLILR